MATVDRAVALLSFQTRDRTFDTPSPQRHATPWIGCEHALSDLDFFVQWRGKVAQQLAEQNSPMIKLTHVPEKTTGGYVLQWYLIIPTYLGALLFHSARRVPALSPRQLGFRLDPVALREVALRPGRFWCLPGDPDAGHPDAVPVPDEAALGAILRRQVIAHATRFLAVYDPQVRFGHRTQWAAVTDERGRTHWTRRRRSCCFLYALPGIEHPCASCPRLTDDERARTFGTRE